jgi:uncharacterized protein (TIGR03000 family)
MPHFKLLVPATLALAAFLSSVHPVTAGHGGGGGGHGGGHGGYHGIYYGGYRGYGYGYRGYGYGYGYGFGIGIGIYPGYPYGGYGYGYPACAAYPVPVAVPPVPAAPAAGVPELLPVPLPDDPTSTAAASSKQDPYYTTSKAPPSNTARLRILLPADAQLWLGDEKMSPSGSERLFVSPELTPGKPYNYRVKARWTQDGRSVEQTAKVKVYANKTTTVEFRAPRVSED